MVFQESAVTIRQAGNPPSGKMWKAGGRHEDDA